MPVRKLQLLAARRIIARIVLRHRWPSIRRSYSLLELRMGCRQPGRLLDAARRAVGVRQLADATSITCDACAAAVWL
jgi:hypothetical protein